MHKLSIVFLASLPAHLLLAVLTWLCASWIPRWYGLIGGVIIMLAAIPLHRMGKKHNAGYLWSMALNSAGCGLSVGAYFAVEQLAVNFFEMAAALPGIALLLLVCFALKLIPYKKTVMIISFLLWVGIFVMSIVWKNNLSVPLSNILFMLIFSSFFMAVYGVTAGNERPVWRDISFGTFGAFVILTLAVIIVISEGEVLEGGIEGGLEGLSGLVDGGTPKGKPKVKV